MLLSFLVHGDQRLITERDSLNTINCSDSYKQYALTMEIMSVYLVPTIFLALKVRQSDGDNLAVGFQDRHLIQDSCTLV